VHEATDGLCQCTSEGLWTRLVRDDRQHQAISDCLGERQQEGVKGGRLHVCAGELPPHTLHDLPHLVHETRCFAAVCRPQWSCVAKCSQSVPIRRSVAGTAFCRSPDMLSHLNLEESTPLCASAACVMQQLSELMNPEVLKVLWPYSRHTSSGECGPALSPRQAQHRMWPKPLTCTTPHQQCHRRLQG
jgi:hypothetical protein